MTANRLSFTISTSYGNKQGERGCARHYYACEGGGTYNYVRLVEIHRLHIVQLHARRGSGFLLSIYLSIRLGLDLVSRTSAAFEQMFDMNGMNCSVDV
jgi:hypothetical protein